MRWSLVLLAACSGSPSRQTSPEPIANTAPPIDAAVVVPPKQPDAQVDPPEAVAAGATLFEQRACKVCHEPGAPQAKGGPLSGLWGTQVQLADGTAVLFDEAYVRESILEPAKKLRAGFPNVMPAYPIFTDDEMAQVTAYIRSLR
jgi:mono/diheme cytochrome c family protein